jgi:hypothetical protein
LKGGFNGDGDPTSDLSRLVLLGHLTVALVPPFVLENTPSGTRYIIEVVPVSTASG